MRILTSVLLFTLGASSAARADLLVASRDSHNVLAFDEKTGAYLGVFNKGANLSGPEALAYGPDGNLYVADRFSNSIVSFDAKTGQFIKIFVASGSGGLTGPRNLAFGPDGRLYVSSNDNSELLVYDGTTGAFIQTFAKLPNLAPRGIVFQRGELFLASETLNQVLHYSLTGESLGVFASGAAISSPREIVFGPDGNMYMSIVASGPSTNAVLKFDGTTGALIGTFATTGLNFPRGLAFDPDGNLYVASAEGNNVVKFSSTGGFFGFFNKGGDLEFPTGVIFTPRDTPPPPPVPVVNSAVNGASFVSGISPGALATIFGKNLSSAQGVVLAGSVPLPLEMLKTSVTIGGHAAPLNAIANVNGQEQINLQVPLEIADQTSVQIVITNDGLASQPFTVDVQMAQPGVFTSDGTQAAALHGVDNTPITADSPAVPGETIVIFATALGPVSPIVPTNTLAPGDPLSHSVLTPTVTTAGQDSEVPFSGLAPGFIGLWQVNTVIPETTPSGPAELVLAVNNVAGKTVTVPVKAK